MSRKPHQAPSASIILRVYYRHVRKYPLLFSFVVIGAIGIQAASLASPLYLRQFFNLLATYNTDAANVHQLLTIVIIVGIISLLGWIAQRIHVFAIMDLETRVMPDLYLSAFDYLLGHSYQFFVSQFAGTLTRRVSKFSDGFETLFDTIMMTFFPALIFVCGAVVVLFLHNQILGLVLAAWTIVFIIFQVYVSRLRQPLRVFRSEQDSKMVGAVADTIGNQNMVALFSGRAHEHSIIAGFVERWRTATVRSWTADEYIWGAQGLLMVGINIGLLYGALVFWQRGELTVGDFVLIQTYLLGTFNLCGSITRELRRFYDAFANASEMVEIMELPHEVQDAPDAHDLAVTSARIEFHNVDFYFLKDQPVLDHFDLVIQEGQKVALVGPSGAGKSTITKLLLRLYDVKGGNISIDGQDISSVKQESLRNAIAFVPQEPILFHRTLLENIRYGRRDASDEEVYEAAKKAHCHEFIAALPEGYETFVGERGVKLSGGERQRVAIARAILKNAPILVLDEATSSLDSESESLIQDSLRTLMEGKTVLVIAHRLSTIMKMDRIVVLQGGAIVADGTHDELLEQGGLYQKLWSIQAGGFIQDEEE